MYNRILDTFLVVADCGSFSKAAEHLHISSTAIAKQISQLEYEVGVQLFKRTSHGVVLTEAGTVFREEAKMLVRTSQEALQRVRRIGEHSTRQIRLGNSILRPAGFFLKLWKKLSEKPMEHRVHIVPFLDNSYTDYLDMVARLGKNIDVVATVIPDGLVREYHCNILEITRLPYCISIPCGHPYREKDWLEPEDLRGESILILQQGRSQTVDEVREELERYEDIRLVDVPDYEPATFNQCESTNQLLLSRECWADVHPMLKTVPVNWHYDGAYGLLYSLEPSEDTKAFIEFVQSSLR